MATVAAETANPTCTADQLAAAGDIGPCELVRGKLAMMSPAGFEHGVVTQRIAALLHAFVTSRQLGVVTAAETGFLLARSPDTVRAPGVAFVRAARVPLSRNEGYFEGAPDLAVEVLSPSDVRDAAGRDRAAAKVHDWLAAGCEEVWVVDPSGRTVTIHLASGSVSVARDGDTFASHALPGATAAVSAFLSPPQAGERAGG